MKLFLPLYDFGWLQTRDPFNPRRTPDHLTRPSALLIIIKNNEEIIDSCILPYGYTNEDR
jgi:hypothetical protein